MGKSNRRSSGHHSNNRPKSSSPKASTLPRTRESSDSDIRVISPTSPPTKRYLLNTLKASRDNGRTSCFVPLGVISISSDSEPDSPAKRPASRRTTMTGAQAFRKHTWISRRYSEDDSDYDWALNPYNRVRSTKTATATADSVPRVTRSRRSMMTRCVDENEGDKDDEADNQMIEEHEEEGDSDPDFQLHVKRNRQSKLVRNKDKNDKGRREERDSDPDYRLRPNRRTSRDKKKENNKNKDKDNVTMPPAVNGERRRSERLEEETVGDEGEKATEGGENSKPGENAGEGDSEKESDDEIVISKRAIRAKLRESQKQKTEGESAKEEVTPRTARRPEIGQSATRQSKLMMWLTKGAVKNKTDETGEEKEDEVVQETPHSPVVEEQVPPAVSPASSAEVGLKKRRSGGLRVLHFGQRSFGKGSPSVPPKVKVVPLISLSSSSSSSSDDDDDLDGFGNDGRKKGLQANNAGKEGKGKNANKGGRRVRFDDSQSPVRVVDLVTLPDVDDAADAEQGGEAAPFARVKPATNIRQGYAFEVKERDGVHLHEVVPPSVQPYIIPLYHPPEQRLIFTQDISGGTETWPIPVYSDDLEDKDPPAPFKYIATSQNMETNAMPKTSRSKISCSCHGACRTSTCACFRFSKNKGFTTVKNGAAQINQDKHHYNNLLLMACGPQCGCPPTCQMRVRADFISKHKLEIFKRKEQNVGFGVRTTSFIGKGELVAEFAGEIINHRQMEERPVRSQEYAYTVYDQEERQIEEEWTKAVKARIPMKTWPSYNLYVDPTNCGNIGRFLTNGCSQNVAMFRLVQNDLRPSHFRPVLVAVRSIFSSEELLWDYGDEYNFQGVACRCNSFTCPCGPFAKGLEFLGENQREETLKAAVDLQPYLIDKNIRRGYSNILSEPAVPVHNVTIPSGLGIADPVVATEGLESWSQRDHCFYKVAAGLAWKNHSCVRGQSLYPCKSHKDDSGLTAKMIEELRRNLKSLCLKRETEPLQAAPWRQKPAGKVPPSAEN